ncbi:Gfo/Idh/MocA family protein [Botrimarina hoheduenensis]|uniref:Glucose--fructose oxidoreductase n=1 Tax=Botrimarina hoheduenensis TaxID=2528000 RepID=A0A5C5VV47_9BACT|nr:Gfo/Idh/MocA family oxidoreductase [Botrimarina hoheduenensis]TWT41402.1 Glucose--fructose oxidoreductase precursor [Botrimarina hoheduenensis]
MIKVGIVGLGFMGMVHYLSYAKVRGVKVVALCERDEKKRAGDWRGIQGNFGPPGERTDLAGVTAYAEVDDLLADPQVEVVDITLPPALHADVACRALQAGKHVFCEKPLAMRLADCDRIRRAAHKADRRLLVGHVLPYFPEYAWALKEASSGKHGRLLGGSFKRVISDPAWLANYWSAEIIGGPLLDLHVHDAHFIRMLFGRPVSLFTSGRTRNGLPEFWNTQFIYEAGGPTVHAVSGTINQPGRPFQHGFELQFERATLVFDFAVLGKEAAYLCPPTVIPTSGAAKQVKLSGGDPMHAFQAELRDAMRAISTDSEASALEPQLARDAIELCHLQAKSLAAGKPVKLSS